MDICVGIGLAYPAVLYEALPQQLIAKVFGRSFPTGEYDSIVSVFREIDTEQLTMRDVWTVTNLRGPGQYRASDPAPAPEWVAEAARASVRAKGFSIDAALCFGWLEELFGLRLQKVVGRHGGGTVYWRARLSGTVVTDYTAGRIMVSAELPAGAPFFRDVISARLMGV